LTHNLCHATAAALKLANLPISFKGRPPELRFPSPSPPHTSLQILRPQPHLQISNTNTSYFFHQEGRHVSSDPWHRRDRDIGGTDICASPCLDEKLTSKYRRPLALPVHVSNTSISSSTRMNALALRQKQLHKVRSPSPSHVHHSPSSSAPVVDKPMASECFQDQGRFRC
jgi:hypothetical protein